MFQRGAVVRFLPRGPHVHAVLAVVTSDPIGLAEAPGLGTFHGIATTRGFRGVVSRDRLLPLDGSGSGTTNVPVRRDEREGDG